MGHERYLYTKEHEWIHAEGDIGTVGITDYAQSQLGDIVTVELPEVGREVKQFESVAIVDSLKTTSDIYSPASGRVVEVNKSLQDHPELINQDPYRGGWIFKIRLSNREELGSLMTLERYEAYVAEEKRKSTARR
ncbi:MAG: glycine cleavage system protein GcvH [Candidatus Brockarchaeota archaeon]|nr:glycine cleavage system protein GcvH [Candidatus Brockarchaeota archaeon]